MDKIKVKLKTGENVVLDFRNYTSWDYTYNGITIRPNTKLIDDSNETYIVDLIQMESIILRDYQNNIYNIPKEAISNFKRKIKMDSALNQNFATFCMYLGSGNIKSKIWFVGIEEGGEAVTEDNLKQQLILCEKETQFFDDASSKTPVWNIIADLLYDKFRNICQLERRDYRQKMFSEKYSNFFLTELFPLPKPNTSSWSDNYIKIFGYDKNHYDKYLSDVRSFRYPMIYNKWNEIKPELTICFGSTYWNEFVNLFKLGHSKYEQLDGSTLRKYPNEKIILTPFFDYRKIKSGDIEALKNIISSVSV